MTIKENLARIKTSLPEEVVLVAVSKTKPVSEIMKAYDAGQRVFGENKVQEMVEKAEQMPQDIQWHMIGHLQRNKVKYMASFVDLIHGVDNMKLLKEINKQGKIHGRILDCLLQVKIAEEDSKYGIMPKEVAALLQAEEWDKLHNIRIKGLMGMATFTEDQTQIRKEFEVLKRTFDQIKNLDLPYLRPQILSMGMSGDYSLAIECGSNMVRIGSSIFGHREQA